MTGYQETLARHRRAVILRILAAAPGYAANETLLREVLAGQDLPTARAQIRGDITWLASSWMARVTSASVNWVRRAKSVRSLSLS